MQPTSASAASAIQRCGDASARSARSERRAAKAATASATTAPSASTRSRLRHRSPARRGAAIHRYSVPKTSEVKSVASATSANTSAHHGKAPCHLGVRRHAQATADGQRPEVALQARAQRAIDEQRRHDAGRHGAQQIGLEQEAQHRGGGGQPEAQRQVGRPRQHDHLVGHAAGHVHAQRFLPAVAREAQVALAARQRRRHRAGAWRSPCVSMCGIDAKL